MMKQWDVRDFIRMLEKNGYYYSRNNGSHSIYINKSGIHISVPKKIRSVIARRLIKEHNLIIEQ